MTIDQWYGTTVNIPRINTENFPHFVFSCVGLVSAMYTRKFGDITIGSSAMVDTAYADKIKHKIIISNKFIVGDFSALGCDKPLSNKQTVSTILGVLVHEIGHFVYTPTDGLKSFVDYVESRTTKIVNRAAIRDLANIIEDIYIEVNIARTFPTLAWTLESINSLMLPDEKFSLAQEKFSKMHTVTWDNVQHIFNFLLYAKVSKSAGKVSPAVAKIFNLARSVVDTTTIDQRHEIVLKIYDLVGLDKTVETEEIDTASSDDSILESSDADDKPETDSGDNVESDDSIEVKSVPAETEVETEDDSTDDDSDDSDDSLGYGDDSDNDSSEESDDSTDSLEYDADDDSDSDYDLGIKPIADDDLKIDIPDYSIEEMQNAISVLGNGLNLRLVDMKNATTYDKPLQLDARYTKLVEIARQRANVLKPLGTARNSGNNVRTLERIITDGKIFADRAPSTNFQPIDVMIVVDCSGSMRGRKFQSAIQQALGCANALLQARCTVQVYGHTSNAHYKNDLGIFKFLDRNENPKILANRLGWISANSGWHLAANRDGYALEYLATKLPKSNKARLMIVISDGQPDASNPDYSGDHAITHTRVVVDKIRKSGINVMSLSIDRSAFYPNNLIYGETHNVNSTESDALDQLVKKILQSR